MFVPKAVVKGRQVNTVIKPPDISGLLLSAQSSVVFAVVLRLSSGQRQSADWQCTSVCEGRSRGENTDGGRIHSQDQH